MKYFIKLLALFYLFNLRILNCSGTEDGIVLDSEDNIEDDSFFKEGIHEEKMPTDPDDGSSANDNVIDTKAKMSEEDLLKNNNHNKNKKYHDKERFQSEEYKIDIDLPNAGQKIKIEKKEKNPKTHPMTDQSLHEVIEARRKHKKQLQANQFKVKRNNHKESKKKFYSNLNFDELKKEVKVSIERFEDILQEIRFLSKNVQNDDTITKNQLFNLHMTLVKHITNLEVLCEYEESANAFVNNHGMERVVYPSLENPNKDLRGQNILLLDKVLKHSLEGKEHFMINAGIEKLLHAIKVETSFTVRRRSLSALGRLLNNNPIAQSIVISQKGLEIFYNILTKKELSTKLLIVKLLYQIFLEHKLAIDLDDLENPSHEELKRQATYKDIGLIGNLTNTKTCKIFGRIIKEVFDKQPNEIDDMSKLIRVMEFLLPICKTIHGNDYEMVMKFHDMHNYYVELMEGHGDYGDITDETDDIVRLITSLESYRKAISGEDEEAKKVDKDEL